MNELIELCGLWKSKTGKSFATGKLSFGSRLIIIENKHKKNEKDPDYKIFIAPIFKEREGDAKEEHLSF